MFLDIEMGCKFCGIVQLFAKMFCTVNSNDPNKKKQHSSQQLKHYDRMKMYHSTNCLIDQPTQFLVGVIRRQLFGGCSIKGSATLGQTGSK
jgi:hypothetical protein